MYIKRILLRNLLAASAVKLHITQYTSSRTVALMLLLIRQLNSGVSLLGTKIVVGVSCIGRLRRGIPEFTRHQ